MLRRSFSRLLLAALCMVTPVRASKLPPGFVETVLLEGLRAPMAMAFAHDDEIWIAGAEGHIWVLDKNGLTLVAQLPTSRAGERGVIGLAIDPDHDHNGHVWIFYSTERPPFRNRLSRFREVGGQLVEETIVLETPDLENDIHNGGCLRFAGDKTLFLSTGDDFLFAETSQDPFDLRGKILHINRDGSPAPGNPYLDGEHGDPRVWAIGLRNPWRFNLQPESETLFIGDVGGGAWEELNLGVPGGNYGWPILEGPEPEGVEGMVYPVYAYRHTSELGHAIIGGDHAPAINFPVQYEGNYFFGDVVTREIFRMVLDEASQPVSTEVFASDTFGGPVDIQFGPDGALYYIAFRGGRLSRISFAGGSNRQPIAKATVTPDNGDAPLAVRFDATASSDPDGDSLRFEWDFGDGERAGGASVEKQYAAGSYTARLTVTDVEGAQSSLDNLRVVSGNARPSVIIHDPAPGILYSEGQLITFIGSGIDPEDGLLPCGRFTWRVIFHHLGHTHPFLGPLQGACEGSFVINSHGQEQTFYEIQLTVEDDGTPLGEAGTLIGTTSIEIFPRGVSLR